jgi:hypothetical protein
MTREINEHTPLVAVHRSRPGHRLAVPQAGLADCRACGVPSCTWDTTCLPGQRTQTSSAADTQAAVLHCADSARMFGYWAANHPGHLWKSPRVRHRAAAVASTSHQPLSLSHSASVRHTRVMASSSATSVSKRRRTARRPISSATS